jgi:hypothetical protein
MVRSCSAPPSSGPAARRSGNGKIITFDLRRMEKIAA